MIIKLKKILEDNRNGTLSTGMIISLTYFPVRSFFSSSITSLSHHPLSLTLLLITATTNWLNTPHGQFYSSGENLMTFSNNLCCSWFSERDLTVNLHSKSVPKVNLFLSVDYYVGTFLYCQLTSD